MRAETAWREEQCRVVQAKRDGAYFCPYPTGDPSKSVPTPGLVPLWARRDNWVPCCPRTLSALRKKIT